MFELERFINEKVILRNESMFARDIEDNRAGLSDEIKNSSMLVIGGAGSIGSSFIKAVLPFEPKSLVVVDINENALAELTRDLRSSEGIVIPDDFITYPMDFASNVFKKMFVKRKGFDIVANFSAHKHVRSEKDIYSIEALLQNNVLNARNFLELLSAYPPKAYFCVSTDKAANPVNIMGASKRIMEDVMFSYSDRFTVKTARFANVAFSNGSLPASFLSRIQKQQPLSAPSDVKRYFVSPEESGQICMLACILGKNREIFFPKLNVAQMRTFDKIAEDLLVEYGYKPLYCNSDEEAVEKMAELKKHNFENSMGEKIYPVHFSDSDTSGEKEYEEFFTQDEKIDMSRLHAMGIVMGKERVSPRTIDGLLKKMTEVFGNNEAPKDQIVEIIKEYLPNFRHIETGKSLDSKM